jgi:hypothetical protein
VVERLASPRWRDEVRVDIDAVSEVRALETLHRDTANLAFHHQCELLQACVVDAEPILFAAAQRSGGRVVEQGGCIDFERMSVAAQNRR